jgi:hypothetical protein
MTVGELAERVMAADLGTALWIAAAVIVAICLTPTVFALVLVAVSWAIERLFAAGMWLFNRGQGRRFDA